MKSGLDYFPLDVHLDEKFELIEAEFGLTGFAVVVKLLQRIYGQQGYYCEWTNEVALLFSRSLGVIPQDRRASGGNVVSEIVEAAIRRGIFDKTLYERYHILTSAGIQKRYLEAVSRRKSASIEKRYLLLCNTSDFKNVNISSENVSKSEENVYISSQSKEEKRKGEKSKEKKNISDDGDDICACANEQPSVDDRLSKYVSTLFRRHFGRIPTDAEVDAIKGALEAFYGTATEFGNATMSDDDIEIIAYAIEAAANAGAMNVAYVRGVLKNLKARGIKNADDLWQFEADRDMRGV